MVVSRRVEILKNPCDPVGCRYLPKFAPCLPRRRAVVLPWPEAAPVMTNVLPLRSLYDMVKIRAEKLTQVKLDSA